jgi:hypothetical protein
VAPQLGAHLFEVAAHDGQLLGAFAEETGDLVARTSQFDVRARQLICPRTVLREQASILDGDRCLVGEGAERGKLLLEAHAGSQSRLEV